LSRLESRAWHARRDAVQPASGMTRQGSPRHSWAAAGDIHTVSAAQALFEAAEWIFSAAKPSFSPAPGVKIPIA